ncbi:hypothetical protein RA086_12155 [Lactiplantibacillus sp. WILCCON 0030]|uniref:ATP synthase subunit I n=1 Tax=Lactiplantibacillus brownii TaxID=3069269 RepID=A0ABU1AD57_9LACO|nr:hypothetical protein [Lactiplantibacillus brownii]MDQ7938362.1 hypothetical protein [Lactiplantibacillus brownii]
MAYMLGLAVFFLVCEYAAQKKWVPKFLKDIRAGQLILRSLLSLIGLAVLGMVVKAAIPLVILATIYLATVISNKYLVIFSAMERGKKE